ncbi:MAG: nuclear transport factor 2 family protein [Parvularculaceae bacterium]|nr:nuclear transport factor 2 family protein [Parvularculaceae bacterium]
MRFAIGALAFMALSACNDETAHPEFRAALDAHLAAIDARDLGAYEKTISAGDFYLIFPDGETIDTRDGVIDFHTRWFADPDWRFSPEIIRVIEGEDMASALVKYDYRDTPDGAPRTSWLSLVFKLEGGEWRLVHDQNTRITAPAAPEEDTDTEE